MDCGAQIWRCEYISAKCWGEKHSWLMMQKKNKKSSSICMEQQMQQGKSKKCPNLKTSAAYAETGTSGSSNNVKNEQTKMICSEMGQSMAGINLVIRKFFIHSITRST